MSFLDFLRGVEWLLSGAGKVKGRPQRAPFLGWVFRALSWFGSYLGVVSLLSEAFFKEERTLFGVGFTPPLGVGFNMKPGLMGGG